MNTLNLRISETQNHIYALYSRKKYWLINEGDLSDKSGDISDFPKMNSLPQCLYIQIPNLLDRICIILEK